MNDQDIRDFRLNLTSTTVSKLSKLVSDLLRDMDQNAERFQRNQKRTGLVVYDQYYVGKSKAIIDLIDEVLASALGLSALELDYIQNYSSKYRVGVDEEDAD